MKRLTVIQAIMHVGAWLPLIVLIIDALNHKLTFNPIQAATQRTGDTAIILLAVCRRAGLHHGPKQPWAGNSLLCSK